jgi:predicted glycoside hydrolase/deacetylase ChbG (UPF0249 family)
MRIISHADDLGMNQGVTERIFSLISQGALTSASLMANGEATEMAAAKTVKYPHCSFGVHLNLTEFAALTDGSGLRPIVDSQGCFVTNRIREVKITSALREAVYNEWCAQIERVLALGVKVSHLDSHHHTHTIPGLFLPLKRVQRRFGMRKVRLTRNIYVGDRRSKLFLAKKAVWNFALRNYYRTKTTSGFASFKEIYQLLVAGHQLKYESVELMSHPGTAAFEDETRLLEGKWRDELKKRIELISYNEL